MNEAGYLEVAVAVAVALQSGHDVSINHHNVLL